MPAIGITGGVATGKSSFVRALLKQMPVECFDADRCVHDLLASDAGLHAEIHAAFPTLPPGDGVDRTALREIVFRSEEARRTLETLIHPRVRAVWQPQASVARALQAVHFFDIPLLYETGIEAEFDRILVIACSPEIQRQRMAENRGLASEVITGMINAQFDLLAKVARANHVVWNDGSPSALEAQARLFATYLRESYG
jgi:dephospho-CoA kinase